MVQIENMEQVYVIKQSGQKELFSEEKVLRSMERVGLPEELRGSVLEHIKVRLHDGITTAEVFHHIKEFLQGKNTRASLRFNLKQAIFELGPTGFPFERYIERIYKSLGYETRVDVSMRGECVMHEIDLVLDKDGKREIVEAKFHNQPGVKTDLHVAMYTYARFLDVSKNNSIESVWLVTNTKLSEDAILYGVCKGIKMIAWNYPVEGNLQDFVEKPEMYPVTILPALTNEEKQSLMVGANIILCCDLAKTTFDTLKNLHLNDHHVNEARDSAQLVCNK